MFKVKDIFSQKAAQAFVFNSLVVSVVYIIIRMILSPSVAPVDFPDMKLRGDYVLMLLQCVVGVLAMLLPGIVTKQMKISVPNNMFFVYAIFLYCAIFLGEVTNFYYVIPHWDTMLHTFSGFMLGALGFSLISFFNKTDKIPVSLSPVFVAIFTFCFAVTIGAVWEIYEFSMDLMLSTNMQKFALESGEALIGSSALIDTMKDLIVDSAGALVMSIVGYISLKYKKGWLKDFAIKRECAELALPVITEGVETAA